MLYGCKVEDPDDIETVKAGFDSSSGIKEEKPHQDTKNEIKEQKSSFNRISPSAKLLITEFGLDASSLKASGHHGTLLKGDVLAAIKSGKKPSKVSSSKEEIAPSPQIHQQTSSQSSSKSKSQIQQLDSFEDKPHSQIRKVSFHVKCCLLHTHLNTIVNDNIPIQEIRLQLGLVWRATESQS